MPSIHSKFTTIAAGLFALLSGANALSTSLAVYYGQGPDQARLSTFCANTNIDIIPIGFVTRFANTGTGGVIETNFGNQCYGPASPGTNFVYDCPQLQEDIPACQALGKKILLSIGGGLPADWYYLTTEAEAQQAADDIFAAFGPEDPNWTRGRPFGDAVVDGFDLDLEQGADKGNDGEVYKTFAQALRDKFPSAGKDLILTAAPQCIYPDAQLHPVLTDVEIEYIFVQFYNNPSCRISNIVDPATSASQLANFNSWNDLAAANPSPNCKWYLGLLSTPSSLDYIDQYELKAALEVIQPMSNFGGAMIWEATTAAADTNVDGVNYIDQVKSNLQGNPLLPTGTTTTSAPATTTTAPFAVTATAPPGETHLAIDSRCNQWYLVKSGDTCAAIVEKSGGTLTLSDFQTWNEAAAGTCNGLWANTWACVGISSGSTTTTTAATTTTTGGSFGTTFPLPPSPTQEGVTDDCNLWHLVVSGDDCSVLATGAGASVDDIIDWNPAVGEQCTNLWGGYYACIGVESPGSTTTTSHTTTTPATTPQPSPTQAGFPPDCERWDIAESGDYCSKFADDNGITLAQLYALNPVLAAPNGCDTSFWLGYYYCVDGPITTTTTTTSTLTTTSTTATTTSQPSPTQEGFPPDCERWDIAESGDYCSKFAEDNGITLAQLYALNPVLAAPNGCDNSFWLGYYYCVDGPIATTTSSSLTTTSESTTSTTASSTLTTTSSTSTSTTESTTSSTLTTTSQTTTSETTTSETTASTTESTTSTTSATTSESTTLSTTSESTSSTTSESTTSGTTTSESTTSESTTSTTSESTTSTAESTTSTSESTTTHLTTSSTIPSSTTATLSSLTTTSKTTKSTSTTKTTHGVPYGTPTTTKVKTTSSSKKCTTTTKVSSTKKPVTTKASTTKKPVATTKPCTKKITTAKKTSTKKTTAKKTTTPYKYATPVAKPTTTKKPCTKGQSTTLYRRAAETYAPSYTYDNSTGTNGTSPTTAVPVPSYTGDAQSLGLSKVTVLIALSFLAIVQLL
ncbi:Endochitinase [Dactylella cylindrospora]|nr:Endochitinase [Dactylella cylindrospora]